LVGRRSSSPAMEYEALTMLGTVTFFMNEGIQKKNLIRVRFSIPPTNCSQTLLPVHYLQRESAGLAQHWLLR